jgi:hypothetical protein
VSLTRVRSAAARAASTHLPAFGLFVLITVIMTWPYTRQIQTSLYNWTDALLNTWTLAWGVHALLTNPLNLYNANIFYPYSNSLAYSESLLPETVVAMPIILATDMPAFAHNLLALSSFVLAAFGMYLLVFDLTRSRPAGLVAGMIYTFTSYKLMHFAHLQLLSSQWMPFALLYLRRTLADSPSLNKRTFKLSTVGLFSDLGALFDKERVRAALLFAIFFSLQALSSFYYAFFVAIAAALYVAYVLVLQVSTDVGGSALSSFDPSRMRGGGGEGHQPAMRQSLRVLNRASRDWASARVVPTMTALGLIAVITVPLSLPYFAVQRELGLERGTQDVEYYAATVRTYFSVPDGNWLYGRWLAPKARMTGSGERDFVGFVAIALALVGLVGRPRHVSEKWFYVLLAVVGVILSFGARNQILSFPKWPILTLPFYLPFRYLFEWVPGFRAMRGPDRFAYLAVLGLAVLAGYGARTLIARIRATRPTWSYAAPLTALVLVALIGLENIAIPIRVTNPATLARPLPDATRYLAGSDPNAVVLEIPMVFDNESLAWPQYYSIFHWRSLVNGFSGFFPPGYDALVGITRAFPSEISLAVLDEIGVRTVVVHNDLLTPAQRAGVRTRLAGFESRLTRVFSFASDDIYELNGDGSAWAAALAQSIPEGTRVWLDNSQGEKREFFELAAPFLQGRELYGDASAAYRPLTPLDPQRPVDFVVTNANGDPPDGFPRRVWTNDFMTVYAR